MNLASLLNTAWMMRCHGEAKAFQRATARVAQTQEMLLTDILTRNRASNYGNEHCFDTIDSPRAYQRQVPLSTYDTLSGWIDRIALGEKNVLTSERVKMFEPTSGRSSGRKLIPYTTSLQRQFQRSIAVWIKDLMSHRPAVRQGRAYWSISPAFGRSEMTAGGIPVGFDDDTAYLGLAERALAKRLLAVPPSVASIPTMENFRYCTLLHLVGTRDLALISVWSPTFLTTILASLEEWAERICCDLQCGTVSLPRHDDFDGDPRYIAVPRLKNAAELRSALTADVSLPEKFKRIWPRLALVSCWADAAAADYLPNLKTLLPWVEIQPKGLIATEGCVSIPLIGEPGSALALRSHFFEFAEVGDEGEDHASTTECFLAHQLSLGRKYRVIITTGGGLYRYQLFDVVEVVGFRNDCPLLTFLGRSNGTCDLVGEKLSEMHVRKTLAHAFEVYRIAPRFSLVAPFAASPPHYILFIELDADSPRQDERTGVAATVQRGLEENPYYRHAIELGQLSPIEVRFLDPSKIDGWQVYERECVKRGQRVGDIKPTALDPWSGWARELSR